MSVKTIEKRSSGVIPSGQELNGNMSVKTIEKRSSGVIPSGQELNEEMSSKAIVTRSLSEMRDDKDMILIVVRNEGVLKIDLKSVIDYLSRLNFRLNNFHLTEMLNELFRRSVSSSKTVTIFRPRVQTPLYRESPSTICHPCKHKDEQGRDVCEMKTCKFTHKGQPCHHNKLVCDGEVCEKVARNGLKKVRLEKTESVVISKSRIDPATRPTAILCHPCDHGYNCNKENCKFVHPLQTCKHQVAVCEGKVCEQTQVVKVMKSVIDPKSRPTPQMCYECEHGHNCNKANCKFVHPSQTCKHQIAVCEGIVCKQLDNAKVSKKGLDPSTRQLPTLCYPCDRGESCLKQDCIFVHPLQTCKHKVMVCDGRICKHTAMQKKKKT